MGNALDALLGGLKPYRRLRGGRWYRLRLRSIPYLVGWFRHPPAGPWEILEAEEDYG